MLFRPTVRRLLRYGRQLADLERPIVLMYHRVADLAVDPWRLAVSPEHFAVQIEVLTKERFAVPMYWLAKELRAGRLPRKAAAVTFDDGYADVLENALPILERFSCPVCVFISTDMLRSDCGFWWDTLSHMIFEPVCLASELHLELHGKSYWWRLSEDARQTGTTPAIGREALHATLHGLLKPLRPDYRQSVLRRLAVWAGVDLNLHHHDRVMTADELCRLAGADAVEIGAHTRTHPSLPNLSRSEILREIGESRRDCEALIDQPVSGFAYPFGDWNDVSVQAVRDTGLQYGVTTAGTEVSAESDPFLIPRIAVANWKQTDFQREILSYG